MSAPCAGEVGGDVAGGPAGVAVVPSVMGGGPSGATATAKWMRARSPGASRTR